MLGGRVCKRYVATPTPPCSNSWRKKNEFRRWNICGKNCQHLSTKSEERVQCFQWIKVFSKCSYDVPKIQPFSLSLSWNWRKYAETQRKQQNHHLLLQKKDTPKIPSKYPTSTTPPNLFQKFLPPKKQSPEIWVSWMTWRSLPLFYSTPQLAHEDFDFQRKPRQMRSHVLL